MECLGQLKQKRDCENRSFDDDKVGEAGPDLEPGANVGDFGEENQTEAVAAQLQHPADARDVQVAQGEQLDEGDGDDEEGKEDLHEEQAAHEEGVEDGDKGADGGGVKAVEAGNVAGGKEGVEDEEDKGEDASNVRAVQQFCLFNPALLLMVDMTVKVVGEFLFLFLKLPLLFDQPHLKGQDQGWNEKRLVGKREQEVHGGEGCEEGRRSLLGERWCVQGKRYC